jgi:hypothetical protein
MEVLNMRIETRTIYLFHELSPAAQKRVLERERDRFDRSGDIVWQHELFDSFKAVYKAAGVKLLDYQLRLSSSYARIDLPTEVKELRGARAIAWLENNLFDGLRMTRARYLSRRKENFGYGYRVGKIPDCPLTGYCADDDFLNCCRNIGNASIGQLFKEVLPAKYQELLWAEYEYQRSDEYLRDCVEANSFEFTENGDEI